MYITDTLARYVSYVLSRWIIFIGVRTPTESRFHVKNHSALPFLYFP